MSSIGLLHVRCTPVVAALAAAFILGTDRPRPDGAAFRANVPDSFEGVDVRFL